MRSLISRNGRSTRAPSRRIAITPVFSTTNIRPLASPAWVANTGELSWSLSFSSLILSAGSAILVELGGAVIAALGVAVASAGAGVGAAVLVASAGAGVGAL